MLWIPLLFEIKQDPISSFSEDLNYDFLLGSCWDQRQPGDSSYFATLLSALKVARDRLIVHFIRFDAERDRATIEGLQKILAECRRVAILGDLGNVEETQEFRLAVSRIIEQMYRIEHRLMHRERSRSIMRKYCVSAENQITRRCYQAGLRPWQQFLNRQTPAVSNVSSAIKGAAVQIVPYSAIRISEDWMRDYKKALTRLAQHPETSQSILSLPARFKKPIALNAQLPGGMARCISKVNLAINTIMHVADPMQNSIIPESWSKINTDLTLFTFGPGVLLPAMLPHKAYKVVTFKMPVKDGERQENV